MFIVHWSLFIGQEPRNPGLWLWLLAINYAIATGKPRSRSQVAKANPEAVIPKSEARILN
ncbi:hypothetical protein [Nostoc sp. FACHB-133]|uniref:hypothetical protein n=1 Tax=Nostoc sp. FACHB-133 TaxID=2692835 RepID=UPI001683D886|nr:hypothetical protein [Nostoc sp. FACHB-133]MBD2522917.1 hypothetical protein [Nostoc sp. FACHB-133]